MSPLEEIRAGFHAPSKNTTCGKKICFNWKSRGQKLRDHPTKGPPKGFIARTIKKDPLRRFLGI